MRTRQTVLFVLPAVALCLGASCRNAPEAPAPSRAANAGPRSDVDVTAQIADETAGTPLDGKEPARTAAGLDHLALTLTIELDIPAIGEETVVLSGTAVFHRSGPTGTDGQGIVGDLLFLSVRGASEAFGRVLVLESPIRHSPFRFAADRAGGYTGFMDLSSWLWLPEHGLLLFGARPLRLGGSSRSVPIVGFRTEMAKQDVALFDVHRSAQRSVGRLAGASIAIRGHVDVESFLRIAGTTVPALSRPRPPR